MSSDPAARIAHASDRFLGKDMENLTDQERNVLEQTIERRTLSRDTQAQFNDRLTFGQRLADKVAAFGGSWVFIAGFGVVLALWVTTNLLLAGRAFDPYPFIFLNLMLSMLAAVQAPVIMMSQNRQAAKDREVSSHDYEVNLKSEIEIMALHEKLDRLREEEIRGLILRQQEQIATLTRLIEKHLGGESR
ncbi:DUF1003 domain-containing protein [Devosia sp. MC532]|uniref:DUF1003 domain-containing protein n=1 Tax=Devosia sp. MC532 TaxID=2799788 RepID=UPI0018F45428|nr:DUF1003 domain-containing protein [Devosia sp. MC532]MBJ7577033.1 DUF1003 domain-containing protein [Devosia sp. MC532]